MGLPDGCGCGEAEGGEDRDRGQVGPVDDERIWWGVEHAVADVPTRVWIWWAMAVVCWPAVLTTNAPSRVRHQICSGGCG